MLIQQTRIIRFRDVTILLIPARILAQKLVHCGQVDELKHSCLVAEINCIDVIV